MQRIKSDKLPISVEERAAENEFDVERNTGTLNLKKFNIKIEINKEHSAFIILKI